MLSHLLTNFEIQKYCQDERKFTGVYSINNLPKIKNGAHAINPGDYKSTGTLCMWIVIAFDLNIFRKKKNIYRKLKRYNKYL